VKKYCAQLVQAYLMSC